MKRRFGVRARRKRGPARRIRNALFRNGCFEEETKGADARALGNEPETPHKKGALNRSSQTCTLSHNGNGNRNYCDCLHSLVLGEACMAPVRNSTWGTRAGGRSALGAASRAIAVPTSEVPTSCLAWCPPEHFRARWKAQLARTVARAEHAGPPSARTERAGRPSAPARRDPSMHVAWPRRAALDEPLLWLWHFSVTRSVVLD